MLRRVRAGLGAGLVVVAGCMTPHSSPPSTALTRERLLVSLPPNVLGRDEGILKLKLAFVGARVAAVRRIPNDWDFEIHWEDGGRVTATGLARHFSARVCDVRDLDDFLLIEVANAKPEGASNSFDVRVTLELGMPDPKGGKERVVNLSRADLVIHPAPSATR